MANIFVCGYCECEFEANPFADFCSEGCRKAYEVEHAGEEEPVVSYVKTGGDF